MFDICIFQIGKKSSEEFLLNVFSPTWKIPKDNCIYLSNPNKQIKYVAFNIHTFKKDTKFISLDDNTTWLN